MFWEIVFTGLLIGVAYYYLMSKNKKLAAADELQKGFSKKDDKKKKGEKAKENKDATHGGEAKTGGDGKSNQKEEKKKYKNKIDHPFFFKSFKKNEAGILDYDFSQNNHWLAIASSDRINVLYDVKHDSVTRCRVGKCFETHSRLQSQTHFDHRKRRTCCSDS